MQRFRELQMKKLPYFVRTVYRFPYGSEKRRENFIFR